MWKIVLLVSLLPTIAALLGQKWLHDRVVRGLKGRETRRSGRELAEALLDAAGQKALVGIAEKRKSALVVAPPQLVLSHRLAGATDVVSLGRVAALTGQVLVAVKQPDLVKWRQWVLRFGWAFPVFTAVVIVFAVVVAKVAAVWGIVIVVAALGISSGLSLASIMIEIEAAKLAVDLLDRSRFFPRSDDEEEVGRCCRAAAFRRLAPACLDWLP